MIAPIRQPRFFTVETHRRLAGCVVLDEMMRRKLRLTLPLTGDDSHLGNIVDWMLTWGLLEEIKRGRQRLLVATGKGRRFYRGFQQRYVEYLNIFEIFGAVDLERGVFALSDYYHMNDEEWLDFIEDDRWDDLRTPIAEHKNICPFEVVFFEYYHEGSFPDRETKTSWQQHLAAGPTWDELRELVRDSPATDQLSCEIQGMHVDGEDVLEEIIQQGLNACMTLWKEEKSLVSTGSLLPPDHTITRDFFLPYRNPAYRSPAWDEMI
jgi:hypothetical protein